MTTGNMTTIARPYALAAFETALAKNSLSAWIDMLKLAADLTQDELLQRVLAASHIAPDQLAAVFCDALSNLNEEQKNFIKLLAENKRLRFLPEIFEGFQTLMAEHEKTLAVDVTSAIPLDDAYKQKLVTSLSKRLNRQVSLQCHVDTSLIGGVLVHAGDLVLDGSVRGKLDRLLEHI